jgi:hypothetical protein
MSKGTPITAAILAAAAIAVTACGGSDSGTNPSPTPSSTGGTVALCKEALAKAFQEGLDNPGDEHQRHYRDGECDHRAY